MLIMGNISYVTRTNKIPLPPRISIEFTNFIAANDFVTNPKYLDWNKFVPNRSTYAYVVIKTDKIYM